MVLSLEFAIPQSVADTAKSALKFVSKAELDVDRDLIITALILANDGSIDSREVSYQLKFFEIDEQDGNICKKAPKDSWANIVWRLHGGVSAWSWLCKCKENMP